ncbi:cell division protein [Pseudomonas fluorescens]|uniref:Cell division protein n=1 Tax=Pseudomonas fluorescens TaxID=294 RepID=A0A5E7PR17_PSEFL|nr:cell division protein [Pseudomonas fluorescens]VVP52235.1 hypothetical protein PS880_05432 [Pseudomonas fluorescens]
MMISSSLRHILVLWLYVAALVHLFAGVILTWAGYSGLLETYLQFLEQALWSFSVASDAARELHVWWLALFGATLQSYSLYMLALVHFGNRLKAPMAWGWLGVGLLLWAPQDMLVSAQKQMWLHLWLDGFALLLMLPPLIWLYRHDYRHYPPDTASRESNHD